MKKERNAGGLRNARHLQTAGKVPVRGRNLICTMGGTPQIVTETLWALLRQEPPWQPDSVHVITTYFQNPRTGAVNVDVLCAELLDPAGAFATLPWQAGPSADFHIVIPYRTYAGQAFCSFRPDLNWRSLVSTDLLLTSVDSAEEATQMGEAIFMIVKQCKQNPEDKIHLSLAGGRKTMSAHALTALTLFGGTQDSASHTLIPAEFESVSSFWHPDHKPQTPISLGPDRSFLPSDLAGSLHLFDVPLIPVSRFITGKSRNLLQSRSLGELANLLKWESEFANNPTLTLSDPALQKNVDIAGRGFKASFKIYVALWILAAARREGWSQAEIDGRTEACFAAGFFTVERYQRYASVVDAFTTLGVRRAEQTGDFDNLLRARMGRLASGWVPSTSEALQMELDLKGEVQEGLEELDRQFGAGISGSLVRRPGSGGGPDRGWFYMLNCSDGQEHALRYPTFMP